METLHEIGRMIHDLFLWVWTGVTLFFSGMVGAAVVGRLAWHTRLVQRGKRQLISRELFYELPIVGLAGYVGIGISGWFKLDLATGGAVCAVLGYFGPGGLQALIQGIAKFKGIDVDLKEDTE